MNLIPILEVIRHEEGRVGAFGSLVLQGELFCTTLEPYNAKQIATGMYRAKRFHSPKFHKDTFKLVDVLGKTDVEFHPGNFVQDTDACIIVGQYPGKLKGQRAVLNSGITFDSMMECLEGYNEIIVIVKEDY